MPRITAASDRGIRMRMVTGDDLTVSVDAGDVVRVESPALKLVETADADGDAVFSNLATGQYWVAVKTGSEDTRRLGSVHVMDLSDDTETRLRAEIQMLNERIQSVESLNTQVSGDGFSVSRMGILRLHKQRSNLQAQLASYLRQRAGLGPNRWESGR